MLRLQNDLDVKGESETSDLRRGRRRRKRPVEGATADPAAGGLPEPDIPPVNPTKVLMVEVENLKHTPYKQSEEVKVSGAGSASRSRSVVWGQPVRGSQGQWCRVSQSVKVSGAGSVSQSRSVVWGQPVRGMNYNTLCLHSLDRDFACEIF